MKSKSVILTEAKRLYDLGFAIHWLHPKSKRPVESGWGSGPRLDWSYLNETYFEGLNVGVRLGTASKISEGHLAVIDIDIKSSDGRHREEALAAAKRILGVHWGLCPAVVSGRGHGSRHYYCVTEKPFKTWNPAQSEETIRVHSPSKRPSKRELEELSSDEIKSGVRLSHAWEISLYSDGRQVVLPPSIHPDSGKPYSWKRSITSASNLPLIEFPERPESEIGRTGDGTTRSYTSTVNVEDFEVCDVELSWLPVSDKIKNGILTGEDVDDRSAFLLPACQALLSAGLSQNEILSVLTDPENFLGQCAYEHAKTNNRKRAAQWLFKYTLKRVMEEGSAEAAFRNAAVVEALTLSDDDADAQASEFGVETGWRSLMDRTKNGIYLASLNNAKLILLNATKEGAAPIGRNMFAANDYYFFDTPWGGKKGKAVVDADLVSFAFYCVEHFGIEFGDRTIDKTFQFVAYENKFHPVQDWLKSLNWDGEKRVDTWLRDYTNAEALEPYLSTVSRKFLVGMVKRVMEPGCKFDQVLILEGEQNAGKSMLFRALASDEWFTDAPLHIGDKDAILTMQSKWIIEMGELSALNKAETEVLKAFISQQQDRIRAPYGKRIEEYPRQCVLAGTTNENEYLRDLTGNRRYWTVKTQGSLNFRGIKEVREQLFAEAYMLYLAGETLYLEDNEVMVQAQVEQSRRLQSDDWISIVADIVVSDLFPKEFEIRDVAKRMDSVGAHKMSVPDGHRIGRCLRLLGYEKFQEGSGRRRKLWRKKDVPYEPLTNPTLGFVETDSNIGDFY